MVTRTIALAPELDWLADDTEESLLGTSLHQAAIVTLDTCLNHVRRRAGRPWFVGNQLKLIIPRRGERHPYQPSPDILVHANLPATDLTSLNVQVYGPPTLVIEVASPATARSHDLDTLRPEAKPAAYAQAGIREYLVFDPVGELIPEQVRAWRLGPDNAYLPWPADPATGRWHSTLGVSFSPQASRLRVHDPDGNLVPTMDELEDEIAALREALRRRDDN